MWIVHVDIQFVALSNPCAWVHEHYRVKWYCLNEDVYLRIRNKSSSILCTLCSFPTERWSVSPTIFLMVENQQPSIHRVWTRVKIESWVCAQHYIECTHTHSCCKIESWVCAQHYIECTHTHSCCKIESWVCAQHYIECTHTVVVELKKKSVRGSGSDECRSITVVLPGWSRRSKSNKISMCADH